MVVYAYVAQFPGVAVMAVHQLPAAHYTAAKSGAQGYHNEILHAAGGAVGHLAYRGGVGIVGEGNLHSPKRG